MSIPYAEVIGDPIAHSKSPLIHSFWLEKLGIDAEYSAVHVSREQLGAYFQERRRDPLWRGSNVTAPHKIAALTHCTLGAVAQYVGATNLVLPRRGVPVALNTDVDGFTEPLAGTAGGRHTIIIGAGGAARAAYAGLLQLYAGDHQFTFVNRTPSRAIAMRDSLRAQATILSLEAPLPPADLVVNATSAGMRSEPSLQIDLGALPPSAIVYDLNYAPLKTALLADAEQRGLQTLNGLGMLVGQARYSFTELFGRRPPHEFDSELHELLTR